MGENNHTIKKLFLVFFVVLLLLCWHAQQFTFCAISIPFCRVRQWPWSFFVYSVLFTAHIWTGCVMQHADLHLQRRGWHRTNVLARSSDRIESTDRAPGFVRCDQSAAGAQQEAEAWLGVRLSGQRLPIESLPVADGWDGLLCGGRCRFVQCGRAVAAALHRSYGRCEEVIDCSHFLEDFGNFRKFWETSFCCLFRLINYESIEFAAFAFIRISCSWQRANVPDSTDRMRW